MIDRTSSEQPPDEPRPREQPERTQINEPPAAGRAVGSQPIAPGPVESRPAPSFPEERLLVRPWEDVTLDTLGHDPRSLYVERYWVSILGPSATLLLRRLATGLEISPSGFELDPVAWAFELGLGMRGGKNSPLWRAVDRTCRFNGARRQGDVLMVRRKLAPLTLRQVEKLPPHLQKAHRVWVAKQLAAHQRANRPDAA